MTTEKTRSWLLLAAGCALPSLAWFLLPVGAWVHPFSAWVETAGALGPALFAAAFVLATLLLIPGTVLWSASAAAVARRVPAARSGGRCWARASSRRSRSSS